LLHVAHNAPISLPYTTIVILVKGKPVCKMSFVTNHSTKFSPFSLDLNNGGKISGISYIPPSDTFKSPNRPLLVAIHGGTCTCHNYDIDTEHTASRLSSVMGIPFVAFNRPGYVDSSTILPLPPSTTYCQEEGRQFHSNILPALWEEFGLPNACTGLVVICHSMAVLGGIVMGGLYARDPAPRYPLAGLILSGLGTRPVAHDQTPSVDGAPSSDPSTPPPAEMYFPAEVKRDLMFSEAKWKCVDPALAPLLEAQSTYMLLEEFVDLRTQWATYRASYSQDVEVPILYALGERDWLWEASKETLAEFAALFPKCPRFDASLVLDASHALEWSHVDQGWYARCFGFAVEVCGSQGIRKLMKL
jgi:hypothetical protein